MHASTSSPTRQHGVAWWLMRGVWGLLAAMHLWPMAVLGQRLLSVPTVGDAFWLASLPVVIGIFALKAVDSRWLRFQRPALEFAVFVVAAALIHGDVVSRQSLPALSVETAATVVAAAGATAVTSRRVRRRVAEWLRGLAGRFDFLGRVRRPIEVLVLSAWRCPRRMMLCRVPARAPPR